MIALNLSCSSCSPLNYFCNLCTKHGQVYLINDMQYIFIDPNQQWECKQANATTPIAFDHLTTAIFIWEDAERVPYLLELQY